MATRGQDLRCKTKIIFYLISILAIIIILLSYTRRLTEYNYIGPTILIHDKLRVMDGGIHNNN